jgi:hypothetical protein
MDRQQIGLKLALDELGLPFDLTDFDKRLVLQKAVCLAQGAGVDLGYFFNWYLRGPYCPALARDAFALAAEDQDSTEELSRWKLDLGSRTRLQAIKSLIGPRPDARRLELLASVLFLVARRGVSAEDIHELTRRLQDRGKDFDSSEVKSAISELKTHGVIDARRE